MFQLQFYTCFLTIAQMSNYRSMVVVRRNAASEKNRRRATAASCYLFFRECVIPLAQFSFHYDV